ncbi:cytochrome O ubiquinol oxidase [Acidihalobacter yilgarnensis]|uniref:Cytochrome bo(3) ubiquinol oxidase subunit 3 n=1 Tax=Acidihalobacter yilgarnensis TaxID=2819280 RepID=A0A1D8INB6_9GAMM|nr:cytochrome c oxidase subunit 3 [Acidihalobacter yilgarnensis]AOU97925.1 cytochrome O ubiquinol oxidase [Acidihalobacter yilgarnensis]
MSSHSAETVDPGTAALWDYEHHGHDPISTRTLGFWLYMLSDAMIFAALFAAYGVYVRNAAGGPTAADIIHPVYAMWETVVVFSSVFAYGLGMTALKRGSRAGVINGLLAAFVLGLVFLGMEYKEFADLLAAGAVPQRSGFLSAYWTIVLTHGLHMIIGLLWMFIMLIQVMREGFSQNVVYRLINLKLFWHFQAIIWVCVFTFVYLKGVL